MKRVNLREDNLSSGRSHRSLNPAASRVAEFLRGEKWATSQVLAVLRRTVVADSGVFRTTSPSAAERKLVSNVIDRISRVDSEFRRLNQVDSTKVLRTALDLILSENLRRSVRKLIREVLEDRIKQGGKVTFKPKSDDLPFEIDKVREPSQVDAYRQMTSRAGSVGTVKSYNSGDKTATVDFDDGYSLKGWSESNFEPVED